MRIALVSPYAFSVHGGVQEQVLSQSRELSRRGHEVLIVAPDVADKSPLDTPATVVRLGSRLSLPANGSRAPLTLSVSAARRARIAISSFSPDVIHFHEPLAPLVGWASILAHDYASVGTFHRSGGGPAVSLTRPLLHVLARGLDVTTAVSESAARTMGEAAGVEPEVLFNGFEVERFSQVPRTRDTQPVVVTVGRLEERKGTATVIDAVRHLNSSTSTAWRLVVVGEGPEGERLRQRTAGDSSVMFVGAVSDTAKREWLRRADVVAAPALHGESFGLVLLEAMASEVPIVASDIDGYRQAAGGHATLFRPGDVPDLARALVSALEHDSEPRRAAALEHARRWSMGALVTRYEDLYERAHELFEGVR